MTPCNIIILECNNVNVAASTTLLTVYLQVCISCKNLNVCTILHLDIHHGHA